VLRLLLLWAALAARLEGCCYIAHERDSNRNQILQMAGSPAVHCRSRLRNKPTVTSATKSCLSFSSRAWSRHCPCCIRYSRRLGRRQWLTPRFHSKMQSSVDPYSSRLADTSIIMHPTKRVAIIMYPTKTVAIIMYPTKRVNGMQATQHWPWNILLASTSEHCPPWEV